ncbi:UDP-N-acetylglucosamine 1-carboxyvinyltransferase [Zongyangia hominis]|uniref:UDP-N-acetylglucosamine 1-carboxyvinyltransferase n=1 Tax=Zongyangia hominis TaxID=2763677 RepID=A0A926IBH6_9FIRM|nr:UDP-N-acetylglucosamine 1-carboxyvinyltransferase [Zongyangia hominis]MBC8570105.1 UDP-N-acetylglucosamine 1-carboxyvinyltransferase [Zongyangia hominis]
MSRLIVEGGTPIQGEIWVQGAKNSVLPILAATLLCEGPSVLHNCPRLSDVDAAVQILEYLGCQVKRAGDTLTVLPDTACRYDIPDDLMREMRSSIVFLGAIIARCQKAAISYPGGCELGPRPIDLHLQALRKLGTEIVEEHGFLDCQSHGRLRGAKIVLSFPSVGATENIMLAACTAKGTTEIINAAREPEIVDLADFLTKCGAKIKGAGEGTIEITGVEEIHGAEHHVIPDRIAAATYLSCAAITGGDLTLRGCSPDQMKSVLPLFEEAGCRLDYEGENIHIWGTVPLKPLKLVRTMPYPGFPTDAQAPLMAMTTLAKGATIFVENIFENRYKHAYELMRMGADIKIEGRVAVVEGVDALHGAQVCATDLRGGAALITAALAAQGETVITGVHHIDRGYETIEKILTAVGARVKRE